MNMGDLRRQVGEKLDSINFWREYAMQDGHKNMCEYVDRTDSFRLKGIDKRKNPVSSNV